MGSAAEEPALWLPIAQQRAATFPGWFIGTHARLLRCTGSGRGWHGTTGRFLVAFAVLFEVVSALYINLFVGILPWAAYTVFLVLSWKLVRRCLIHITSTVSAPVYPDLNSAEMFVCLQLFARRTNSGEIPKVEGRTGTADSTHPGDTLNLLNYNVFQRSPGSPGGADGYLSEEFKDQRLEELCRRLESSPEYGASLDLICVQELFSFGQWRQEKLLATAGRMGFHSYVCSPNVGLLGGWGTLLGNWAHSALKFAPNLTKWVDGGVMILSRYPVVASRTMEFANASGGDMFAAKGPCYLRLSHPNPAVGIVHVFSMHLQASENFRHKDGATEEEKSIRTAQVTELLDFIDECVGCDPVTETVLLAGDWNIDAHAHRFEEKSQPGGLASSSLKSGSRVIGSPPAEVPPSAPPGGSPEYRDLVKQLRSRMPRLRDLVLESARAKHVGECHPVTYGALREKDGKPFDTILTEQPEHGCQAFVDYVFLSQPRDAPAAECVAKVDKMECDEKVVGSSVLSDHFAVSCKLKF